MLLAALAGCSNGAEADLPAIKSARSLAFEWATINRLDAERRINRRYADSMRQAIAEALETTAGELGAPRSAYGQEIGALVGAPLLSPPDQIEAHGRRLKTIEDQLESA